MAHTDRRTQSGAKVTGKSHKRSKDAMFAAPQKFPSQTPPRAHGSPYELQLGRVLDEANT